MGPSKSGLIPHETQRHPLVNKLGWIKPGILENVLLVSRTGFRAARDRRIAIPRYPRASLSRMSPVSQGPPNKAGDGTEGSLQLGRRWVWGATKIKF